MDFECLQTSSRLLAFAPCLVSQGPVTANGVGIRGLNALIRSVKGRGDERIRNCDMGKGSLKDSISGEARGFEAMACLTEEKENMEDLR